MSIRGIIPLLLHHFPLVLKMVWLSSEVLANRTNLGQTVGTKTRLAFFVHILFFGLLTGYDFRKHKRLRNFLRKHFVSGFKIAYHLCVFVMLFSCWQVCNSPFVLIVQGLRRSNREFKEMCSFFFMIINNTVRWQKQIFRFFWLAKLVTAEHNLQWQRNSYLFVLHVCVVFCLLQVKTM